MYKIRKIKFKNHPILNNLELDFCDRNGNAVDTVILAGENGTGKSTILNAIYEICNRQLQFECDVYLDNNGQQIKLQYYKQQDSMFCNSGTTNQHIFWEQFVKQYPFSGIYSDVDINFHTKDLNTVTSLTLDSNKQSKKSDGNLPTTIKQLLIDVQALDDADYSRKMKEAKSKGEDLNNVIVDQRMNRFTNAFKIMFEKLQYDRIENVNGHKEIFFKKDNIDIPIDKLSSGEKQIVFRGCFLLRDVNALNGAFGFIDEPEISLHPTWQKKILDYYKNIFTNEQGAQTSQLFVVTHSPFIIHNENRKNDKVIVLKREDNGEIVVSDKQEYFNCDSISAIQDAFNINDFNGQQPTVYLEGRTDEKYFNKALEVFGYTNIPFVFKWIGYVDNNGQERNTGKDNLNKAVEFLIAQNSSIINVCLFDCDTNKSANKVNNVYTMSIPKYRNSKKMKKGIENALVFDDIDLNGFYYTKTSEGDYGETKSISEFDKMKCCDAICQMDNSVLEKVFANLKSIIDELISIFEGKQ